MKAKEIVCVLVLFGLGAAVYVALLSRFHVKRAIKALIEWDRRESGR